MDPAPPPELERLPPSTPPVSRLAVASLLLGLLPCGVTSVAGLVCGILAKSRITRSRGGLGGNGLATAGIVVSALGTLLAGLAGLMVAGYSRSLAESRRILCVNNLKQIGLECRAYAIDHDGKYPAGLQPLSPASSMKVFVCPANPITTPAPDGARFTAQNTPYPYFGANLTEQDRGAVVACCTNHGHAHFLIADGRVLRFGAPKEAPGMRLEAGRVLLESQGSWGGAARPGGP